MEGEGRERESNWMGTPAVSPLKTQNALSSAVGRREGAGERQENGGEEGKITVIYNASYVGRYLGMKPRKQIMHPGCNWRILSNIMFTSDLAK